MSLRTVLAASAVLAFAAPALAQEAPAAPPAAAPNAEAPAAEMPSEEFAAALARIEAFEEPVKTLMADLETRAAVVRADATLSDEDKATRIRAMMAEHQPTFDGFAAALSDLIRLSAIAEGTPAEEAAAVAAAAPAQMTAVLEALLINGDPDNEEAADEPDHADHPGDHEGH